MRIPRVFLKSREKEPFQPEKAAEIVEPLDAMAWAQVVENGGVTRESVSGAGNQREHVRKLVFATLSMGDFSEVDQALAVLEESISPETWSQMGDSFLVQGKYCEAIESFRRAKDEEGQKRALADLRAGIINGQSRYNFRYFLEIFEMVEGRPFSVQETIVMADEAFDLGKHRQAEYIYYEIPLRERTVHVSRRLGDIEMQKLCAKKTEYDSLHLYNAVAFYKEARYVAGLRCIVGYYAACGNFDGIIDIFSFLGVKPTLAWCQKITALRDDDPLYGIRFLKEMGYPDEVSRIGNRCLAGGKLNDAMRCYRSICDASGLRRAGDVYRQKGDFFMAHQVYREINYEPDDALFYEALAREFIRQGKIQEAQLAFKKALQIASAKQSDEPSKQSPSNVSPKKFATPVN